MKRNKLKIKVDIKEVREKKNSEVVEKTSVDDGKKQAKKTNLLKYEWKVQFMNKLTIMLYFKYLFTSYCKLDDSFSQIKEPNIGGV